MKTSTKIALIYGVSFAAAGGMAYWRNKRNTALVADAFLYGFTGGTLGVVIGAIASAPTMPQAETAKMNGEKGFFGQLLATANTAHSMGKVGKGAIQLLSNLDTNKLYAEMRSHGVKVSPIPENPSMVSQETS